jgi:ABC-type uncharacterized transport system involved in gliding motility auxiliary subunit
VLSHFENVARGVVDLRDVVYFVSTTALFVVMALSAVLRERLSHARAEWRRMSVGVAVVALLVLGVNLLGSYVRGRLDLTSGNLYTLDRGTRDLLGGLQDLVEVQLFASAELPPELQLQLRDVRDLFADMENAANGNLRVTEINPDDDPEAVTQAEQLGIGPVEFNVMREDQFDVRRGYYGYAIRYADRSEVTPIINGTDDLEFRLASTIYDMTTTEHVGIGYTQGFGAQRLGDVPGLMESLGERYEMRAVDLQNDSAAIPSDVAILAVMAPSAPMDSSAVQRIRDFIDRGGSTFMMLETMTMQQESPIPIPLRSGLEPLLQDRGVLLGPGLVMDLASNQRVDMGSQGIFRVVAPYPLWPIARPGAPHAITSGQNQLTLAWAGAFEITDTVNVTPLWQTTEAGAIQPTGQPILPNQDWTVPDEELGVRTLAVAVTPPEGDTRGRMVAVGDADFLAAQFIQSSPGNFTFLANSIDWLAQDEALIRIRSKDRAPPTLVFESDTSRNLLKWGNLVGVPLLVALFGLLRVTGRRRRAQSRWREVVA